MTDHRAQAEHLEQVINGLFLKWREDPANFTFCQTVRAASRTVEMGDITFPQFEDGSAMLSQIASKVCGGQWEYSVHSIIGNDPICIVTRYKEGVQRL